MRRHRQPASSSTQPTSRTCCSKHRKKLKPTHQEALGTDYNGTLVPCLDCYIDEVGFIECDPLLLLRRGTFYLLFWMLVNIPLPRTTTDFQNSHFYSICPGPSTPSTNAPNTTVVPLFKLQIPERLCPRHILEFERFFTTRQV